MRTRRNDYNTSIAGAEYVTPKAPTQKIRLLRQFKRAGENGLTDEEAAYSAGLLDSCFWKRCGELRKEGLIVYVDAVRKGHAGIIRKVSVVTEEGDAFLTARGRQ